MMTTPAGPSPFFERSELALGNLNRALAEFQREIAAFTRRSVLLPSRLFARTHAGEPARGARTEDALVRFVAIADEFTLGLLIDLTEAKLPTDRRVALLWDRFEERHTDTWEQRFSSWEGLHQITVSAFPNYSPLWGYIEARNALVHGLGALTRKQLRTRSRCLGRLSSARIHLTGDRLTLRLQDATNCAGVVRDLIEWLDNQAAAVAS